MTNIQDVANAIDAAETTWIESERNKPENAAFFAAMDQLSDALNKCAALEADEQTEIWSNMEYRQITPAMVSQVLINALPFPEASIHIDVKTYWLHVSERMGPEWIESLRKMAAFMDKVDSFR